MESTSSTIIFVGGYCHEKLPYVGSFVWGINMNNNQVEAMLLPYYCRTLGESIEMNIINIHRGIDSFKTTSLFSQTLGIMFI